MSKLYCYAFEKLIQFPYCTVYNVFVVRKMLVEVYVNIAVRIRTYRPTNDAFCLLK